MRLARPPLSRQLAPLLARLFSGLLPGLLTCLIMCPALANEAPAASEAPATTDDSSDDLSTSQLEERLATIDTELDHLARYSLRSGHGTIGWRSQTHDTAQQTEWIQIDLGAELAIDQIVLVPALMRNAESGYQAEGFPIEFKVMVGNESHPEGFVLSSYGSADKLLPRQAPLIIPCSGTKAQWLRVEATTLSPRSWDGKYLFQLSEIMIFRGQQNVALNRPVQTSHGRKTLSLADKYLVDGFMPYLMDAAAGEQSPAYLASIRRDEVPHFSIDLGSPQAIDRIHLHAVDVSDSVPQPLPTDIGMPDHLQLVGANQSDFSDARLLVEYRKTSTYDTGPILARRFPSTTCRYVKLTALEPFIFDSRKNEPPDTLVARIGFAEIELFAGNLNVALKRPVLASVRESSDRHLSALTDGRNQFGNILSLRTWMEQLARRHELETQRPEIAQALKQRYLRQKDNLRLMIWLAVLLLAGIIIAMLVGRITRMRQIAEIRQRLAADLHDELGANFHTIGLLGDVAMNAIHSPERLQDVLQRNKEVTARTGSSIRHFISLQETHGTLGNLHQDMKRIAHRILADIEYDIQVEGEPFLVKLKPVTRDDLRLFFKECLVNISRHADATKVTAQLKAERKSLTLSVCDNGRGISDSAESNRQGSQVPSSLKRRAHLLRAKVSTSSSANGGTRITLKLKIPWRQRQRKETSRPS